MRKVKIVTDSNSGILQSEAEGLGISVLPMPFTINDEEYLVHIKPIFPGIMEYMVRKIGAEMGQRVKSVTCVFLLGGT